MASRLVLFGEQCFLRESVVSLRILESALAGKYLCEVTVKNPMAPDDVITFVRDYDDVCKKDQIKSEN